MEATMKSEYAPLGWTFSDWKKMRERMALGITDDDVRLMRRKVVKDVASKPYDEDSDPQE
jgi:hypothetical protein